MGRAASKFTPEIRAGLIVRVSQGVSLPNACRDLNLNPQTAKGWIRRGKKEGEGDYHEFAEILDGVRQAAKSRLAKPMTRDELARQVSSAARSGSVAAMKLRLEMLRDDADEGASPGDDEAKEAEKETDSLGSIDELAAARAARSG